MKISETLLTSKKQKRSILALVITVLTTFCLLVGWVSFSIPTKATELSQASLLSNEVLLWKIDSTGSNSLQDLVDGYFCENAINGNVQTYVQAIISDPHNNPDLSGYELALTNAIETAYTSESGLYPTSLQKSIITLCMCHAYSSDGPLILKDYLSEGVISEALNNTIGKKGIMSYIYGLNMLEALEDVEADYSCEYTRESIILLLLEHQLEDGGYALSGDEGDVDVTAMTLRSLSLAYLSESSATTSPYSFTSEESTSFLASIERSVSFLKTAQLPTGDYGSYGTPCSESTAQVILAICALNLSLEAFTNNDYSALDGLLNYRMDDGSFSHSATPLTTNDMASSQAYEALSRLAASAPYTPQKTYSVKSILYIIIACTFVISLIVCTLLYFRKKNRKKYMLQLFTVILLALIATAAVYFINISSPEQYVSAPSSLITEKPTDSTICISYSINCSTVEANADKANIYSATLYVAEGSTAFDVLAEICRINDLQLDYESNSVYGTAYIKGINSLYEFDYGDLSGWMYRVNGEFPSIGCGYYTLKEGDCVEWLYTKDLGRDLQND